MSRESEEKSIEMDNVDIDVESKESYGNLVQNSGRESDPPTEGTGSASSNTSSEQVSSLEDIEEINDIKKYVLNNDGTDVPEDLTSSSSEVNLTGETCSDAASGMAVDNDVNERISIKTSSLLDELPGESCILINNALPNNIDHKEINSNDKLCNNLETASQLATSTVSLNEGSGNERKMNRHNSLHSKSAENITCIVQNVTENKNIESRETDLNTEQILSQFTVQKTKASATQKIAPEPQNDAKFTRIPKEILSQDIGSIVKNVHGIFSSVSGSLKYAYSNTGRGSVQKLLNNVTPLPHHKITTDLVKEQPEQKIQEHIDKVEQTHVNGIHLPESPDTVNHFSIDKTDAGDTDQVDPKKDVLKLQIESLEQLLAEQRRENVVLKERVKHQTDELLKKDNMFKELENKMDIMVKRVECAEREKDAAVMRYAGAECGGIEARRAAERAAASLAAAARDSRLLEGKLRAAQAERERLCQLYDDKNHELLVSEREVCKLRDEQRELEGRLKWTQSKLRAEMDAYKESNERAEKLAQQMAQLEAAAASAGDAAKVKALEGELKECRAALILCRHERSEVERALAARAGELEECERERVLSAAAASAARADAAAQVAESARVRADAAERLAAAEAREARALQHAERVTAERVAQQAAAEDALAKADALEADARALRERVRALRADADAARARAAGEAERRARETKVLARKVAELTEELAAVNEKLEWEKGENGVLKKKHASAVKELNRELQRALRRCEQLEARPAPRPESVSSVSSAETTETPPADPQPDVQGVSDRQALIERIVSLQRAAARRADRCEFLEEHARQLTDELRRKGRLLRHLLTTQPAGALATPRSDANKKEIARLGGGAMAALWGAGGAGGAGGAAELPAELAREMTARLQAVLEDALLKNITLKENMDTLGEEIARLKQQKSNDVQ